MSSSKAASLTDVLRYSELPMYPPYRKNQLVIIPLNRSVVLGPQEVGGINLPLRFSPATLQHIFVALPAHSMDFIVKTNGCRIWGVFCNLSSVPQHLSPRFDLLACRTTTALYSTPDQGPVVIPSRCQGILCPAHCHQQTTSLSSNSIPTWLLFFVDNFLPFFSPA